MSLVEEVTDDNADLYDVHSNKTLRVNGVMEGMQYTLVLFTVYHRPSNTQKEACPAPAKLT